MSKVVPLRSDIDAPAPPAPPDNPRDGDGVPAAPIGFLGQQGGLFHFFDYLGQHRCLTAQQLGRKPDVNALFGELGCGFLADRFPAFDKEGKATGGYNLAMVNLWLIGQSGRQGVFDAGLPERGIGVWQADGVPVLHLGDRILWGEEWRNPGFREGGALWPAASRACRAAAPAPPSVAVTLEGLMGRWNWQQPGAAAVVFGLWAAGMMGAAIPWRPHGFIVGQAFTGKSTFFTLLAAANPLAETVNDYTEPGLRQTLEGVASAALLDEADADQAMEAERLGRVVGLLRRVSGGEGAVTVKGTPDGRAKRFVVIASFMMGAILPPILLPQDASRITRVDLLRRAPGGGDLPSAAEIAAVRVQGPALLARAMAVLPRFPEAFAAARAQMLQRDGEAPRVADQIGAILAARHIMQHDDPLGSIADCLDELAWAIPTAEERDSEGGPQQCLHHLLHATLEVQRHGARPTVLRTLITASVGDEGAKAELLDHGMRYGPYPLRDPSGPRVLYVMNTHQQLARIFASTRWAGGKWREDLARLPGAFRPETGVKFFRGVKTRCVVVPGALLPEAGDGGDDAS